VAITRAPVPRNPLPASRWRLPRCLGDRRFRVYLVIRLGLAGDASPRRRSTGSTLHSPSSAIAISPSSGPLLHLGPHTRRARHHLTRRRPLNHVLQQGGLAHPRLPAHHQRPALTGANRLQQPIQRLALAAPPTLCSTAAQPFVTPSRGICVAISPAAKLHPPTARPSRSPRDLEARSRSEPRTSQHGLNVAATSAGRCPPCMAVALAALSLQRDSGRLAGAPSDDRPGRKRGAQLTCDQTAPFILIRHSPGIAVGRWACAALWSTTTGAMIGNAAD
jgi:hypothetical protein